MNFDREDTQAKRPLIVLTGPTASGKSELAVWLCKKIDGEIISADSMQVYRGMDIGSAKIRQEQMDGIPHYLIDVLEPDEPFDVTVFQRMAIEAMTQIYDHGHIPVITGGTGFYIQAVLYDIDFTHEETGGMLRRSLEKESETPEGRQRLYERLQEIDPKAALAIHPNNIRRVIRAIEFYEQTGTKISAHNEAQHLRPSPYDFRYFVLTDERAVLYSRIDRRVDQMIAQGLVDEVRGLKEKGYDRSLVSMQGLGYKEILSYLDGECTLEEAIYTIKRDTRHFAKRQLTWFRRERDVITLDRSQMDVQQGLLNHLKGLEIRSNLS